MILTCLLTLLINLESPATMTEITIFPPECPRTFVQAIEPGPKVRVRWRNHVMVCDLTGIDQRGWWQFTYYLSHPYGLYQGTIQVPCHAEYAS